MNIIPEQIQSDTFDQWHEKEFGTSHTPSSMVCMGEHRGWHARDAEVELLNRHIVIGKEYYEKAQKQLEWVIYKMDGNPIDSVNSTSEVERKVTEHLVAYWDAVNKRGEEIEHLEKQLSEAHNALKRIIACEITDNNTTNRSVEVVIAKQCLVALGAGCGK